MGKGPAGRGGTPEGRGPDFSLVFMSRGHVAALCSEQHGAHPSLRPPPPSSYNLALTHGGKPWRARREGCRLESVGLVHQAE